MKKKICISLLSLISIGMLAGCGANDFNNMKTKVNVSTEDGNFVLPNDAQQIVVSELRTVGGKTVPYVDNNPFASIGVQIRTDAFMNNDRISMEEMEILFEKAAELGVTTVEVPVQWKDVEVGDDKWDWSYMDLLLSYCYKYDLKCELLWFGTNMCGDTHSYSTPEYILCDGKKYPKLDSNRAGEFWSYYGNMWFMDFTNENLLEREGNAITKVLDYVYLYDVINGQNKHPIVAFQVMNEADCFARFRLSEKKVLSPTSSDPFEIMSQAEGWDATVNAYNRYGLAAKNSKYKVYTRVNLAKSVDGQIWNGGNVNNPPEWIKRIYNQPGIDAVGDDSYTKSINDIKGICYMFGNNLPGNFSHIAENEGKYSNTASLILTALSQGAGYNLYDLVTPPFFINHGAAAVDQGICTLDIETMTLTNRDHFDMTASIIEGVKKAGNEALDFNKNGTNTDFAPFNCKGDGCLKNVDQTININNVSVRFVTTNGGVAFAIRKDNHVNIYSTCAGEIYISNANAASIKTGYYNHSTFVEEESLTSANNFHVEEGKLYRVDYNSSSSIGNNVWGNLG